MPDGTVALSPCASAPCPALLQSHEGELLAQLTGGLVAPASAEGEGLGDEAGGDGGRDAGESREEATPYRPVSCAG